MVATATAAVVTGLLAVYLAWTAEARVLQWTTHRLAGDAIGRLEARLLNGVGANDFDRQPAGQPGPLYDRLSGLLDRARADGEHSLIQVNIYAPDGTILFSGQSDRVGRKVLPSRVPRLAGALSGAVNTRLLLLSQDDDADLTGRYTDVLAVYTPIYRDGDVVAAAEVYADPTPLRLARLATWIVVVGPVIAGLLLYVRRRQVEQADQVERLIGEAFFDSLTGLANRALFRFRLQQAFHRATRRGELMVVMFLDLDRFKSINDTLGHAAGDQLLIVVGERLLRSVRPEDTVSRLAGDEFTVLLEEVPSLDDACAVAQRILDAMRHPFVLAGQERTVHTSIGIAARTLGHLEPEDVLHDADLALYQAKEGGRDRYAVYRPGSAEPIRKAS
jgi:diguanylate cyclase (GGDEF)-like protein